MTSTRWEYLRLHYIVTLERPQALSRTWKIEYHIRRAGLPEETRPGDDVVFVDLLDELGRDGWELIAEHVIETGIFTPVRGVDNVGQPVSMVWTFKRPFGT